MAALKHTPWSSEAMRLRLDVAGNKLRGISGPLLREDGRCWPLCWRHCWRLIPCLPWSLLRLDLHVMRRLCQEPPDSWQGSGKHNCEQNIGEAILTLPVGRWRRAGGRKEGETEWRTKSSDKREHHMAQKGRYCIAAAWEKTCHPRDCYCTTVVLWTNKAVAFLTCTFPTIFSTLSTA